MKKVIVLVGCASLLAIGATTVSCKKDDTTTTTTTETTVKGCTCKYTWSEGTTDSEDFDIEVMKMEYSVKTCSELQSKLLYYGRQMDPNIKVSCTKW